MATIGDLFVNLNANTSNFEGGMNRARGSANNLGTVMGGIGRAIAGFMIYDVGKKLVSGFIDATKAGIDYNATLETSKIAWTTLLGTQEKANKMLKDIEQFAKNTPFDKMGVDNMSKQLNNAGLEGKGLFDQLTKFGDIGGAFGVQQASLEEMVRQYSQVKQAGVAYTEDLNILQDRGVPIYKAIAKECGISTAEVKKWASEGKISADIYQAALDSVAKGVEGGMAKQSKSFTGMVSTLKDGMSQAIGILSKPLFDKMSQGLQSFLPIMDKVISSLSENGLMGTIQRFAPGIMPFVQMAIGIFQALGNTVGVIIQSMTGFWQEHSSWLGPLIGGTFMVIFAIISSTITAIGNVVQSGLAVIDGIINFFQNLFTGNFRGCWESIKQIFSNGLTFAWNLMQVNFAVGLPGMIKNFGANAVSLFSAMWSAIKGFFSGGISGCLGFVSNLVSSGSSSFNSLRSLGSNAFQALFQVGKDMMSNLFSAVSSTMSRIPSTVSSFMNSAVSVLRGINLFSIGTNMINGLINGIKSMGANVAGAIGGVVNGAISSAKKALGINSPSKLFTQFGKWTGQGLAIGIYSEGKNVAKASKNLSESVVAGYSANLKGINVNSSNNNQKSVSGATNITINSNRLLSPSEIAKEVKNTQRRLALGF